MMMMIDRFSGLRTGVSVMLIETKARGRDNNKRKNVKRQTTETASVESYGGGGPSRDSLQV